MCCDVRKPCGEITSWVANLRRGWRQRDDHAFHSRRVLGAWRHSTIYENVCRAGHPLPAAPASGYPMPAAPASGHPMPAGVGAGLPPPPTLPDSLFMAYCPERPGGQRPAAPMGISIPNQGTGIVTKDPGSGVLRTLSPTPYRGDQVSAITALWAPNGLGMLRDGKQQYRRIY